MTKIHFSMISALTLMGLVISINANAKGVTPVTTGAVVRGVTLPTPVVAPAPGTSTGRDCDFSGEAVNQAGKMTGASVNCQKNGTPTEVLEGLPVRFNAYCITRKPPKSARLLPAKVPGNDNHCDLSGITPKDATGQFKGAVWR
ncbi:MAG: protein rhiC [Betaproteobacteria bacterium]|nr:protein rhiC [Betaproteobacteria bacterium]